MVINTKKGYYEIIKNHKAAFKLEVFEECYIEECFDKYEYIVGDLSDNLLRLKGFCGDNRKDNYIGRVEDYFEQSCAFMCPHYILKRITKAEYEKERENKKNMPVDYEDLITPMEKVPFDKENLNLESSVKDRSNIVIDVLKQNKITLGVLPQALRDSINKEKGESSSKDEQVTTYYSSSSDGFEPKKTEVKNNNNKKKNKYHNNNNKKNNGNGKK